MNELHTMVHQSGSTPARTSRARVACRACNARRVRCNASQARPCSNCTASKEECQLIESKRGKYKRSNRKHSPAQCTQESHFAGRGNDRHSTEVTDNQPHSGQDVEGNTASFHANEGSEMLYARLADVDVTSPPTRTRTQIGEKTIYLGKSFNLAYIVDEEIRSTTRLSSDAPTKMHWQIPQRLDDRAHNLPGVSQRLEKEELDFLNWRGAMSVPEKSISDRLLRTYFDHFHPAFPIYDRAHFAVLYNDGDLSLLTLQAVYFLASTMCDEGLLRKAGFPTRFVARETFYKRAKALYDCDYETDKLTVIRALLLMSFCWNGPTDEKDAWHWLGAAIGRAQSEGMHRSTLNSDLSIKDQCIWRRIWWTLYVRDRHNAAYLGRPPHINDSDCDVELLQVSDFDEIYPPDTEVFGVQKSIHSLYAIHSAKLAIIAGNIISAAFSARGPGDIGLDRTAVSTKLKKWKDELPSELVYGESTEGSEDRFWVSMIHLAYSNNLIMLNRPSGDRGDASDKESQAETAFGAATLITHIVESLLVTDRLRWAQLHLVPSIFSALTMHIVRIRGSGPIQQKVAETHAHMCMLALHQLQNSWPVCSWILHLFKNILNKIAASKSHMSQEAIGGPVATSEGYIPGTSHGHREIPSSSEPAILQTFYETPQPSGGDLGMGDRTLNVPLDHGPGPQSNVDSSNDYSLSNAYKQARFYQPRLYDPISYTSNLFFQDPGQFLGTEVEYDNVDQEVEAFLNNSFNFYSV